MIASAANGGGTKITDAFAPVSRTACSTGIEDGQIEMLRSAFAWSDAPDHLGAVCNRLLRVERAFPAGEALNQNRVVSLTSTLISASPTTFSAASFMPSAM
jgi:hypothetical protein